MNDLVSESNETLISQSLVAEQIALKRLKLPVPKRAIAKLDLKQNLRQQVLFTYEIPRHLIISIEDPSSVRGLGPEHIQLLLVSDPRTLAQAEQEGLQAVAFRYPGLWLSRDPYGVYKFFAEGGSPLSLPQKIPPPEMIPGIPRPNSNTWNGKPRSILK
jgi:hypothetical protein